MNGLLVFLLLVFAAVPLPQIAAAGGHEAAAPGPAVLTVEGRVRGGTVRLDLASLSALPQKTIVTTTPWFDGAQEFRGPLLADVLAAAGAEGTTLRAVALNDYSAVIPMSDAVRYGVILATEAQGRPLSVRDKGPIWIIYPLSAHPELVARGVTERLVWQLARLVVE